MINIKPNIQRRDYFWKEVSSTSVGAYRKALIELKRTLEKPAWDFEHYVYVKRESVEDLVREIDQEIAYCDFYFELKKKRREANFNKWDFLEEKDRKARWGGKSNNGDCYFRSNGKIKITINVKCKVASTRVSITVENDGKSVKFYGYDYPKELSYKSLRNVESIKREVDRLKDYSEILFDEHFDPHYHSEKNDYDILQTLLKGGESNAN